MNARGRSPVSIAPLNPDRLHGKRRLLMDAAQAEAGPEPLFRAAEEIAKMQRTKLTRQMRRSLEERLVDLDARIRSLDEQRDGDDSPDATALLLQISRERHDIANTLAAATLIDDDPFDTEATEVGDTITIRQAGGETDERYVLVDGTVGSRASADWVSVTSPLGAALLGRAKGDEVVVDTPAGSTRYVILSFERACDDEGASHQERGAVGA